MPFPSSLLGQARELKSVHVNVPGSMLRLVIHKAHVNKLNIYNQVRGLGKAGRHDKIF